MLGFFNKNFNKKKIFFIYFFIFLISFFVLPHFSFAAEVNTGNEYAVGIGLPGSDPRIIIARVIQIALGFLGIIAVILIMYAGWLWMTSGGNEEKIEKAKNVLKNAIIGLVIIFSAFAIVSFIISKLSGIGTGGPGPGGEPDHPGGGIGALGACSLESVYPEPGQTDPEVPRNTSIIVTFKEEVDSATVCDDSNGDGFCKNENIITDNIKIFHTNERGLCLSASGICTSLVSDVKVSTNDNKTFVFMPVNWLGSPSEYIWYSVYLSNDIEKIEDGKGIFDNCRTDFFEWNFEVSNKIDLTPPQVKKGDVFPPVDNEEDVISSLTPATQATGLIEVKEQPNYYQKSIYEEAANNPENPLNENATVDGEYNCLEDGMITISISGGAISTASVSGVAGLVSGDNIDDEVASLGCGLTLVPDDGSFEAGNSWTINVIAEVKADTLKVSDSFFKFVNSEEPSANEIKIGTDINTTANNIKEKLDNHSEIEATVSENIITITANISGKKGNEIILESNSEGLEIAEMSGGQDKMSETIINDKEDQPRNSIIQVNFNEAIMPIQVSGDAEVIKDYIRIKCTDPQKCVDTEKTDYFFTCGSNTCIRGSFVISNIYRTVEFISNNKCGVNACGEDIYCLPGNSNLVVELVAAHLETCITNEDCSTKTPFTICDGVCKNGEINYPVADRENLDGVMDVALNSLDGNRNENAEGPITFYNENVPVATDGDNYKWSFFINDKIDLEPPVINFTGPNNNEAGIDLINPIEINFNKLMMSKSLATGEKVISNGDEEEIHRLLNIWNFTSDPLGYWIAKENVDDSPRDDNPDWTKVFIKHSLFSDTTNYRAQVGSGVLDIYQNCFKPSSSSTCTGTPSCCGGVPKGASRCTE